VKGTRHAANTGYKAGTKHQLRLERKAAASERQIKHDALTVKQRIEKLDKLLGVGMGAKKERARLANAK
jgi:hypothetical protein